MKAADLRKSILQAAVMGRLVPQDKSDEPAFELLKRIQAEKAALIKGGKLKKEKPLPPITADEIPYDLPDGWAWCRLADVSTRVDYGTSAKAHEIKGKNDIPVLRMGNLQNGIITYKNVKYIDRDNAELPYLYLNIGDLLFNRTNSLELVGKTAIYCGSSNCYSFASYLIRVRFCAVIPNYISIYLNSSYCRVEQIEPNATQQNGQANFNGTKLKHLFIPLPPLAEQQRIVDKVDELMSLSDELEDAEKEQDALKKHLTEDLPKSILQAAVQGKLVPQDKNDEPASELLKRIQAEKSKAGKLKKEKPLSSITEDEIPYDLPDGWVWCKLKEIGEIVGGATPDSGNSEYYALPNQGIPWITPADMKYAKNNYISHGAKDITQVGYDSCSTKMLPTGSVIFSSRAPIGHMAFAKNALCTNQGFKSVMPYCWDTAPWVFLALKSKIEDIESRASGTTFKEVSGSFMEKELVPLPPLAEQQRIAAKVDELMTLCEELKHVDTQLIDHSKVVPFPAAVQANAEPFAMAARGDAGNLSAQAKQAIEDLFGDDE